MSQANFELWQRAQTIAAEHDFPLPPAPYSLGEWCRVPAIGKGADNESGAYLCSDDCVHLKRHVTGWSYTVFADRETLHGKQVNEEHIRRLAEQQQAAFRKKRKASKEAAELALAKWMTSSGHGIHPCIQRKGLSGLHNARIDCITRALLIPMWVPNDGLVNLQRIFHDGKKRFMKDCRVKGAYSVIGELNNTSTRVIVCEGWATGATLAERFTLPIVVAFNTGNLKPACESIAEIFPHAELVVAADDDRQTPGNPGRKYAKADAKAVGAKVLLPKLCMCCTCTDHNDMAVCNQRVGR